MIKTIKRTCRKSLSTISPTFASKVFYKKRFKRILDLKNPITLNEKLQWLKLNTYNNNDLVTTCVDKYKVREYLKEKQCDHIANELIGVWESANEIDWDSLPNKFVLKCNHGAGYNIVCTDKTKFDVIEATRTLNKWMKEDYWKLLAEINYKYVPKRIICEKFIETESGDLPDDYKVYCFNGKPTYIMLCQGRREGDTKFYFLDREWNIVPLNRDSKAVGQDFKIPKPEGIEEMFKYAEILSEPFPFVRADFYLEHGRLIFGELTFTPAGALDSNRLPETDKLFGDLLELPNY